MADNVTINPGAGGSVIATDDIGGGVQVQRVKIGTGADGAYSDVSGDSPIPVEGIVREYRDELSSFPGSGWQTPTVAGSVVYGLDGNAAGAGYLRVTLDPRDPNALFDVVGDPSRVLKPPFRQGWGVTLSRRSSYFHAWFGQVGVDSTGAPVGDGQPRPSLTMSGGVVVVSNVATVTTTTSHGLSVGQRVATVCTDPRFSTLATISSVPTPASFTFTFSATNATYGTGGTVYQIDASLGSRDCVGLIASDATSGNAVAVSRTENLTPWVTGWNPGQTWDQSVVPNNVVNYSASYTYPHQARFTTETMHEGDWLGWLLASIDATATPTTQTSRDQNVPRPAGGFAPRIQIRNLPHTPVPLEITAATKTASSTATLTIPNHGLTAADWIIIYGIRDQAAFANQTSAVQVASVVDANRITATWGATTTATSYGGVVLRGVNNVTGILGGASSAIQTITTSTTGRTQVTFAANFSAPGTVGESVCLVGLVDSAGNQLTQYEGLYRVASSNTTTFIIELDPLQGQPLPATTTVGGTLVPAIDFRLHFLRARSHTRVGVEIESGRGHSRGMSSVPVTFGTNVPGVNFTQLGGSTVSTNLDAAGAGRMALSTLGIQTTVTDRSSAATTTSGNSGTIVSGTGNVLSAIVNVSAVTGTTPILDVVVQESFDGGTTWQDCYWLPRITATGQYQIPPLLLNGRRRYNYIVAGTSPSFTFSIVATGLSLAPVNLRQLIDRAIVPNTLGSTSAALYVDQCSKFGLVAVSGAGATVNPTLGVQFSIDGTNWADAGISLVVPPSGTVGTNLATPWPTRWARVYVKAAGTAATHTYAALTASS